MWMICTDPAQYPQLESVHSLMSAQPTPATKSWYPEAQGQDQEPRLLVHTVCMPQWARVSAENLGQTSCV